jgi:pimeloyl-ACP methyl ester carboxylesterase
MGRFICNGVETNYRTMGEGKDVVLIHGLAANHGFWHLNVLLSLSRFCRITVYDLRGHGYSSMPMSGYTTCNMANDLHELLNHLNIRQANIIGHSFGGSVALNYAILHPERIESLVIADSRIRSLQPTNCIKDWPNWKYAVRKLEDLGLNITENETEAGLRLLEHLASPQWQQTRHKLKDSPFFVPMSAWGKGKRSANNWLKLLYTTTARQDFVSSDGITIDKLKTIVHPTLAVYGEHSPAMTSLQNLVELLPNCKTSIIPKAGHFSPFTNPDLFSRIVVGYLKEFEPIDRRLDERLIWTFPVTLWDNHGNWSQVMTVDVSKKGLLVETIPQLETLPKLEINAEIELKAFTDHRIKNIGLKGKVVRKMIRADGQSSMFGIELFMDADGFYAWENYLAA